jgi:peptide/nickel transport system substrate-binding protein
MKKTIFAIVFVAIFAFSLAMPAQAFFYPGADPYDDGKHNQFGPMTPSLLITPWGGAEQAYTAYKACTTDIMDWPLLATQVAELKALDPTMVNYSRAFYIDRGMRALEYNNMKFPTDDADFREALAHCFDKDDFVATQLDGLAVKMDTPLTNHGSYYNNETAPTYPYNLLTAKTILDDNGYTDKVGDHWREGPGGEEIFLDFYIRQDDPDRSAMGTIMAANLESIDIHVNEHVAPKTTCWTKVMVEFDYHIYTGGWSFGRDPTTLYFLYYGEGSAQAYPYCSNYPGYNNPIWDDHADLFWTAEEAGNKTTPGTAIYEAWEMQRLLAEDIGVTPVFTYASYGSYKSPWSKVVNTAGVGPWGTYSFLNMYKTGDNTIDWGFMNDIEALNPIMSSWVWDWNIIGLVWDSLINVDPYDPSVDQPWMASSWTQGVWNNNGTDNTWVEFKIREDIYWHDIVPKADRKTPGGAALLPLGAINERVMADDVAFSVQICKELADAWNHDSVENMLYCEEIDPFTVKVYFDVFMPMWAMHQVAGLPILPKHVWYPVFLEGATNVRAFNPIAEKCASGSGAWIFDYVASSMHNYYMLRANTRYFRYHPIDVLGTIAVKVVNPCTTVNVDFYLHNMDAQHPVTPPSEFTITITKTYPNATVVVLYEQSNPPLPFCELVHIFHYEEHIGYGKYVIKATITPDPLTGHTDLDGYPVDIWGTIVEDINLDFYVNAKDAIVLGKSFSTNPHTAAWNPLCDLNSDGYVNAKDAIILGKKFNWPS